MIHLYRLCSVPPAVLPKIGHSPPSIRFPEDNLVRSFYRRNPGAFLEPIDLRNLEPSSALLYALEELEAKEKAEDGQHGTRTTSSPKPFSSKPSVLAKLQVQEHVHLRRGLDTLFQRHCIENDESDPFEGRQEDDDARK